MSRANTSLLRLTSFGEAPIDPLLSPRTEAALSLAGTALGAYHGYRRSDSIGGAIGWGLLGSLFPLIVIPVAFAQGFGKPAR